MMKDTADDLPPLVKAVLEARRNGSSANILKATEDLHAFGDADDQYHRALFHNSGDRFRRRVGRTLFELMNSPSCPLIHEPKHGDHVFVQIEATAEAILHDLAACGMLNADYVIDDDAEEFHEDNENDHRRRVIAMLKAMTLDRQANLRKISSESKQASI